MACSRTVLCITTLFLLAPAVLANCAYGTSMFPRESPVNVSKFGYDGLNGPLNWYALNLSGNALCSTGKMQSPIVLNSTVPFGNTSNVNFAVPDYPSGALFENLGTNVEVVVNGSLTVGGMQYDLAQFHFHTPAEHRIADEFYPMEMHIVFETKAKQLAVIAFLIDLCPAIGCTDPLLASVFSNIGGIVYPGNATMTDPLYFSTLRSFFYAHPIYQYNGSLTSPPCSENLLWLIGAVPLQIDVLTFNSVKRIVKYNARYTQDILGGINLLENAAMVLSNATSK